MKNLKVKASALLLILAMLMSFSSCSFISDIKSDLESRRSEREEEDEDKGKKKKKDKDEDEDEDDDKDEDEDDKDPTPTPEPDETEPDETEPDETEADPTPAPAKLGESKYKDYLIFPDEPYDAKKVHPEHKPGDVTGKEAKEELDAIEKEIIKASIEECYIDGTILFEDYGAYDVSYDDVSWGTIEIEGYEEDLATDKAYLDRLYALDYESFEESDRVFYDKLVYDLEESVYMGQYPGFQFLTPVFNSFTSQQCNLFFILDVVSFSTKEDAENYIKLLEDLDRYYDELCDFEEERVKLGYAGTDELYDGVAESFDNLVAQKDDCFLYESFEKRLDNIKGLSDDDKKDLIEKHEKAMKEVVFPEMEECSERMSALKGNCTNELGVCGFEHGKDYYEAVVRSESNSLLTPDEAAKAIDDQLSSLFSMYLNTALSGGTEHDYTEGDVQENLDFLYTKIFEDFPQIPDHEYTLREVPDVFKDSFSPAAYLGYHLDNFNSNLLLINSAADRADFGTVVAHEAYPGHMYQSLYTRSITNHLYMVVFDSTGYAEGWAQYVELNSPKYYGASNSEVSTFIIEGLIDLYLQTRMDLGINYEGWTTKDAVDHFNDLFGMAILNEAALGDVFAILTADPGYACPYGLGYYNITKTLDAIKALDPDMDLKRIHEVYLNAETGTYEQILESAKRQLDK